MTKDRIKGLKEYGNGVGKRKGKGWKGGSRGGWLELNLKLIRKLDDD